MLIITFMIQATDSVLVDLEADFQSPTVFVRKLLTEPHHRSLVIPFSLSLIEAALFSAILLSFPSASFNHSQLNAAVVITMLLTFSFKSLLWFMQDR